MKHKKFESIEIKKSQFVDWLKSTLESKGWVSVASNPSSEGFIYQSKGEDGNSDIIVNFTNNFLSSNNKYFEIRMLVSYKPSNAGKNGTRYPTSSSNGSGYTRLNLGLDYDYLYPETKIKVHYNCNKNSMTFLFTTSKSTVLCMFGRPETKYSKEYSDTGNMIFATNNSSLGNVFSYGVADKGQVGYTSMKVLYNPIPNGFKHRKLLFCEIGYETTGEGIKGALEGVYYIPITDDRKISTTAQMTGDKYIDELGNEYTLFYIAGDETYDGSTYKSAFPIGYITVCTKLAGEE